MLRSANVWEHAIHSYSTEKSHQFESMAFSHMVKLRENRTAHATNTQTCTETVSNTKVEIIMEQEATIPI